MKKLVIILAALLVTCVATITIMRSKLSEKNVQIFALENNQRSLLSENETFRTSNEQLVTKVTNLSLTKEELNYLNDSIVKELKDSKVKIKNLTKYIDIHISSSQDTKPSVRDSLVYINDSTFIKGKAIEYDNYWYHYKGVVYQDSASLKIGCNHDIHVFDEPIYKGWWIFKKLKRIETTVLVTNPNDTLTRVFSVDVVNKKRKR